MKTFFLLFVSFGVAGFFWYLYFRHREITLLARLSQMIDQAAEGALIRQEISETQFSALENSLKKYLNDTQAISRDQQSQKDSIQQMISDIAHQTLTPISNLKLYTELLAEDIVGHSEEIDTIFSETKKLDFLIRSLVELSRMESGIIAVHPRATSVAQLFEYICSEYRQKAQEKEICLSVAGTMTSVICDPKWTCEALGNLVDNAIKYTPSGGNIYIAAEKYSFFTGISIKDTGIGIREEEINRIFARFYRSPDVVDLPGVGIGLSLTREIIYLQKGYMKVNSELKIGSTFTVFLPTAQNL